MNQNSELKDQEQELKDQEQWLLELVDDLIEAKKAFGIAQQALLKAQAYKELVEGQFFDQARKVKAMRDQQENFVDTNPA